MGYMGCRIPGHSGTDFKHKKVFNTSKKAYLDNYSIGTDSLIKIDSALLTKHQKSYMYKRPYARTALSVFIILVLCSVLFFLFSVLSEFNPIFEGRTNPSSIHYKNQTDEEYWNEEKNKYVLPLMQSGKESFAAKHFEQSVNCFYKVISLDPFNEEAVLLIRDALEGTCTKNNLRCEELKKYNTYIERAHYVSG